MPPDEFVDKNHPYMTEHNMDNFSWGFDREKAMERAAAMVGAIIEHTLSCGAEHAIADWAVQAGITTKEIPKGTQFPVLMFMDRDEEGSRGGSPVCVMLLQDDSLPLMHTLGSLVTEDGVLPALPSQGKELFDNPVIVDGELAEDPGMEPFSVADFLEGVHSLVVEDVPEDEPNYDGLHDEGEVLPPTKPTTVFDLLADQRGNTDDGG